MDGCRYFRLLRFIFVFGVAAAWPLRTAPAAAQGLGEGSLMTTHQVRVLHELALPGSGVTTYTPSASPVTYGNADLTLTTYYGKGTPAFTGQTFSFRQWNGTV